MKQRSLLSSPSVYWVFMIATITSISMSSCGLFNRGSQSKTTQSKIPTSYNKAGTPTMTTQEARIGYIERYKRIAVSEMERTGVPASIKLAQGLLESDAGRSTLSANYNNHFGIKCHSTWQGERFYKEDDDIDPLTGQLIKSCFRVYKNADESFIAHSDFLRDPAKVNRYGSLFQLQRTDYVGWAQGLQRSGYATAQDYSDKLIRIIQDYQLAQYDNYSLKDVATNNNNSGTASTRPNDDFPVSLPSGTPTQPTNNPNPNTSWLPGWTNPTSDPIYNKPLDTEGERNNVKYARAYGQMTPYELAGKYSVSISNLQTYNEELPDPRTPLEEGTVIYLQKKRNYWRGAEKTYRVRDCETMYDISQKFGIKLSKLYSKNEMRQGEQPAVGQIVLLRRGWFEGADKPALRDTFGDWRRCKMDTSTVTNPNVVTYPPMSTTISGNSGVGFEITPNGQPSPNNNPTYYPPQYPTTPSYPSTTPSYPATTPSYPSTTPSYPSTTPSYPATTPSYPSTTPSYPSTTTPTKPSTTPAGAQYHTVGVKETLWAISRKYGITVDALKQMNGITDNIIKPGQQLRVK